MIVLVFVMAIFFFITASKNINKKDNLRWADSFYSKKRPLTQNEQAVYYQLVNAFGDTHIVLAQVAFSSFLKTHGDKETRGIKFAKMRQKVADFVICSKAFDIELIIEIDDKTHNVDKDRERDDALSEAGITVVRYMAGKVPTTEKLKELLTKPEKPITKELITDKNRIEPTWEENE